MRLVAAFEKAIRGINVDRTRSLPRPVAYLVAVVATSAAAFARYELNPLWGIKYPFLTFYPAVAVAAWFGGLGPGVLASATSTAYAFVLFLAPFGSPRVDDPQDLVALTLFAAVNVFISVVVEGLHRARRRAAMAHTDIMQSEERLRGVVASATDAIITLDSRQRVVLFNTAGESMFRCAAADVVGQPLDRFIPTHVRARHRDHIRAFGETAGSPRLMGAERVLSPLRANGEEFPIEAHISKATVGTEKLYTVILRDITERKRAEAEREELLAIAERARGDAEAALEVVGRMQSITEAALIDLPFDDLLHELACRAREALDGDTAVILLEENGTLRVRAAVGLDEGAHQWVRVPVGTGFAGRIANERRLLVLNGVQYDDMVSGYFREKGIRSLIGVPLLSGEGRVLGVLHVGSIRPRTFTDQDGRLLQVAAERIALAVERGARIEAEHQARAAGFDYHLTKPVGLDALQGIVARFGREDTKPPMLH